MSPVLGVGLSAASPTAATGGGRRGGAVVGGRVVADGCSSVAVAAPDASTERRVCRSVSGAAAALAAAEWAIGGSAASAAVETASSASTAAGATWGAVASGSEGAGCRGDRETGGVVPGAPPVVWLPPLPPVAGFTEPRAAEPCCPVRSPPSPPAVPIEPPIPLPAPPDPPPATMMRCSERHLCGERRSLRRRPIQPVRDVRRSRRRRRRRRRHRSSRRHLASTRGLAALAAYVDEQGFARCDRERRDRPCAGTWKTLGPLWPASGSERFNPKPANTWRHNVRLGCAREIVCGVCGRSAGEPGKEPARRKDAGSGDEQKGPPRTWFSRSAGRNWMAMVHVTNETTSPKGSLASVQRPTKRNAAPAIRWQNRRGDGVSSLGAA